MRHDNAVASSAFRATAASHGRERTSREKERARTVTPRRTAADEAAAHEAEMQARLLAAARIAFHLGGED